MNEDIRQHGVGYKMLTSLPIVGPPSKFLMDYTKMGIDQYGYLLGILRGGLAGLVMFSVMLFLSEAIPLGWSIIRYYFDLRYVQPVMAGQRGEILDLSSNGPDQKVEILGDLEFDWLDPGRYLLRSKRTEPPAVARPITPTPTVTPVPVPPPPATPPTFEEKPKLEEKASSDCTGKPVKGCLWLQSSKGEKLTFLLGTHDAVSGDSVLWNELFRKDWTFEDMIENLDKFYSDSAKRDVPIIDAMKEVRSR